MKIKLNNYEEEINVTIMTISELLEYKKFTFKMLVIKVNNQIVKRDDYEKTIIKDGDDVIVMHLVSGG